MNKTFAFLVALLFISSTAFGKFTFTVHNKLDVPANVTIKYASKKAPELKAFTPEKILAGESVTKTSKEKGVGVKEITVTAKKQTVTKAFKKLKTGKKNYKIVEYKGGEIKIKKGAGKKVKKGQKGKCKTCPPKTKNK